MTFINKNANIILLFLIILSATALVGATIFFQMNFERINAEYHDKVGQLQTVSKDLATQQELLERMRSDLSLKSQREEVLGEKYTEVQTNKEQLEGEKQKLQQTKEQLQDELANTEGVLRDTRGELAAKKDLVNKLTNDNSELQSKFTSAESKRKKAEDDLSACQVAKAACTCP